MRIRLRFLSWWLVIPAFSMPAIAQSIPTTHLKSGKAISGDLSQGQTHSYSIKLKRNQYVRAVVRQSNAALAIELDAPDGKKTLDLETRIFRNKPAPILWVAKTAGWYVIRVSLQGSTADAKHYSIKVEDLRRTGPDEVKGVEAEAAFMLGVSEARKYEYDPAFAALTRALDLYRGVQDREREGDVLSALGTSFSSQSQFEKAIGYFDQALAIARKTENRYDEGGTLNDLGIAYKNLGQVETAAKYYQQALVADREAGDLRGEGNALSNLAGAYNLLGDNTKAVEYYQRALTMRRQANDRLGEGNTLSNLGIVYFHLSQYGKAIEFYEQALPIRREITDRRGEGDTLNNLGNAYMYLARYEEAIRYFEEALQIAREIKFTRGEANILGGLGNVYILLGQDERAIGYHEQALVIHRQVNDLHGQSADLTNLAAIQFNLHQNEKAVAYLQQALVLARETKNRAAEGEVLDSLGCAFDGLGDHRKAIDFLEQALVIRREVQDRQGEGATLNNLAGSYQLLNQNEKAVGYDQQAVVISREVKDPRTEAEALSGLMEVWQAAGQPRLAIFFGKQAVNTVQSMRSDLAGLSQDLQQSFLKGNEKPYHTLAELLIAQGRLAESEQILALLKEEEYFQYIRRSSDEAPSLNRRADLTPEEAEYEMRYREIGDRLMAIGAERGELLAKPSLPPDQSQRLLKLEQDLAVGNRAFERFLGDLTQHFSAKPEVNARVVEQLREEEGFMEDLRELPTGTVAIYTVTGEDKFHAILQTPDAQKAYEYPIKAADLNRLVFAFRQAVADPRVDPRPLAKELYQILIAPMAEDLRQAKAQTLMWSLDGALRYVPIAALYDGTKYLIEQYRISVMTLASNARLKDRPDRAWSAAGFGVTKKHGDNEALPEVAAELEGVEGILHGEIRLDERFTEATMRETLLKRFPVVHIASHFRFQPGDQSKSFLLLGDGGHLSMAELRTLPNLFRGVQLLTLSACNTGVGDGTEVEGFGTLAQRQGAKAVIASLWPVADSSTSRLMQEFYRIRESSPNTTKLEALREAQLELLRGDVQNQPRAEPDRGVAVPRIQTPSFTAPTGKIEANAPYAHPFYWAAFFLMGNWL